MKKFTVISIIFFLIGCSNGMTDKPESENKNQKSSEPKEVGVLKEDVAGMGNTKPFNSSNGEFYIVAKYKNDCDKNFTTKLHFEVELTRPDKYGSTAFDSFSGKELKYGESSVDTFRVYKQSGQYYIKYYLDGNCKANFEVIDLQ